MDLLNLNFKHPYTIQVSGPTRGNITIIVRRILKKQLIKQFATCIIWVYSEWQPVYDLSRERFCSIKFEKSWRHKIFDSLSLEQQNILLLDYQIGVAGSNTSVADLIT